MHDMAEGGSSRRRPTVGQHSGGCLASSPARQKMYTAIGLSRFSCRGDGVVLEFLFTNKHFVAR